MGRSTDCSLANVYRPGPDGKRVRTSLKLHNYFMSALREACGSLGLTIQEFVEDCLKNWPELSVTEAVRHGILCHFWAAASGFGLAPAVALPPSLTAAAAKTVMMDGRVRLDRVESDVTSQAVASREIATQELKDSPGGIAVLARCETPSPILGVDRHQHAPDLAVPNSMRPVHGASDATRKLDATRKSGVPGSVDAAAGSPMGSPDRFGRSPDPVRSQGGGITAMRSGLDGASGQRPSSATLAATGTGAQPGTSSRQRLAMQYAGLLRPSSS